MLVPTHRSAVAMAQVHEAVVEVLLVGRRHTPALGRTSEDREQRVDERHGQDHERKHQRGEEEP